MTKRMQKRTAASLMLAAVITIFSSALFYSCKKTADKVPEKAEVVLPGASDRLLTVANVFNAADGKTVTAWFYETPLVHEFSRSSANAEKFFSILKDARERSLPVNVRVAASQEGLIESVIPATDEQVRAFKEAKAKEVAAEEAAAPESITGGTNAPALVGVIPNIATLNTIFNALRNQCCKLAGPYLYGQCIPFQYVADGCYARAHKMRQIIEGTYGYTSYKVFNYADQCPITPGSLAVNATLWGNNCCVRWWYHVAPYVYVQSGTSQVAYLLDPSMHSAPVAISTWLAAQKNTACGYTAGTVHKQAYYTSSAYAPSGYNYSTCTINVYADNTYTAANSTCAAYAPKQGCF
jgi:Glutaminase